MDENPPVRPFAFSTAAIDAAVQRELAKVPDGNSSAVIAVAGVDQEKAKLVLGFRLTDGWSFGGYLEQPYKGKVKGGAELRFSR